MCLCVRVLYAGVMRKCRIVLVSMLGGIYYVFASVISLLSKEAMMVLGIWVREREKERRSMRRARIRLSAW